MTYQFTFSCTKRMSGIKYTSISINDGNRITFRNNEYALSLGIGSFWYSVSVALIKNEIVLPYLIGYTCFSRLSKAVLGYRDEVLFFDGEYLCRYLFCCPVFFSISGPFKPFKTSYVKAINVIQYSMFCEVILCVLYDCLDLSFGLRISTMTQK